jgi:hypothetical protein
VGGELAGQGDGALAHSRLQQQQQQPEEHRLLVRCCSSTGKQKARNYVIM